MKRGRLEDSYVLKAPANWRGTYITRNGRNEGSRSWYKDGDIRKVNYPHITVTLAAHETDIAGEWVGLHVSVPFGGQNYRYNYSITNGTAKYTNTTITGMLDPQAVRNYGEQNAKVLDAFAREFVRAALSAEADAEMLAGVKQLFTEQR